MADSNETYQQVVVTLRISEGELELDAPTILETESTVSRILQSSQELQELGLDVTNIVGLEFIDNEE